MAEDAPAFRKPEFLNADRVVWIGLGLFLTVWVVVMLRNLGYLSLWMDEGFHYLAAQGILQHGYPLYPSGHIYWKAIFYAYVLALLAKVFGLTALTLRIVSVFSVAGLIGLAYFVGRRFFSRTIGVLAALILAFSVWEIEDGRLALYFAPLQLMYLAGLYVFYQAFVEDRPKFRPWVIVLFFLTPQVHQLGMGIYFCFPALLVMRGLKRFLKKDVLFSFGAVTLFYLFMQVSEYFFWKVGYVYAKTDTSLRGMVNYFFSSFNLDYFKEFFRSFPWMSLVVLGGIFLYLGMRLGRERSDGRDRTQEPWLYLILCLVFPLLFFGIFRTHVQPRYLAQLYPVFILLFLVGLRRLSDVFADLAVAPFAALKPSVRKGAALALFLAAVLLLTEGAGPKRALSIINRRYTDPITADFITRSGRFKHEDNANTGLYVRHFLRPDDLVIAIHVVFQKVYVGRVDYWLWSGGPGTWDAWENTADGWKDFYVGARWINSLDGLKKVTEGNPGRRVWLVGSTSLARRDHINKEISEYLLANEDKTVFRGWDGVSQVYLWNDDAGAFKGTPHALEGEWLPGRWGTVVYGRELSKEAAMSWPAGKRDDLEAAVPAELPPGRYAVRLRLKTEGSAAEALAVEVVSARTGEKLRTLRTAATGGDWAEPEASFALPAGSRVKLRLHVPGAAGLVLDWIDIVPIGSGP